MIKDNYNLLSRNFSACCKIEGIIYIFGGSDIENDKTDTIFEVNIYSKTIIKLNRALNFPSKFTIQNSYFLWNNYYVIDDDQKPNCYKFDKSLQNFDILTYPK